MIIIISTSYWHTNVMECERFCARLLANTCSDFNIEKNKSESEWERKRISQLSFGRERESIIWGCRMWIQKKKNEAKIKYISMKISYMKSFWQIITILFLFSSPSLWGIRVREGWARKKGLEWEIRMCVKIHRFKSDRTFNIVTNFTAFYSV